MLPDIESLRCFEAAASHLNFRSAARAVGLSPAAFGDRIKRLEDAFDVRLFERTTRRVALTRSGQQLLPQARRCLEEARRCHSAARGDEEEIPFDLTIGTRFELGLSWLTPALGGLEQARPARRLHLCFGDTPELLARLRQDDIDCLVTSARLARAGLSLSRLHEERYALVAAAELLAARPLVDAEDAAAHNLLELNDELPLFRYLLDALPAGAAWRFATTRFLGTIGAVRARALEGAGVAVLPWYFVEPDVQAGNLVRLMPHLPLPVDWFRLIWRRGHPQAEALRQLAAELARVPLR